MTLAEQIKALLLVAADSTTPVVKVRWHPGASETPMDEARPAYLGVEGVNATAPEFRVYHPDGHDALLEALNLTEKECAERRVRKYGKPDFTVMKQGDELVVTEIL